MKYAMYMRVARGNQISDGLGACANQKSAIEEYAKENGLEVVEQYYDLGYSGNDTNRPGLQAMISDYTDGRFDGVLTVCMDRLTLKPAAFPFPVQTIK